MTSSIDLYLDLMKRCVLNHIYQEAEKESGHDAGLPDRALNKVRAVIARKLPNLVREADMKMSRPATYSAEARSVGRDWPRYAHTMIGEKRLDNLRTCVEDVLNRGVPGDLIETGVWRGGATIFMRAVLAAHGVTNRVIYVADSFGGLPKPDTKKYPQDTGDIDFMYQDLKISLEQVQENFRRYGLLDDQVRFIKGWFSDTLPHASIERLAILRLDGDMYGSTMDALQSLYPKVSIGGYVIVDDYGAIDRCRQAVEDYRTAHGIGDPIVPIDWTGVYWQRSR
jgi:O-methyltransferase